MKYEQAYSYQSKYLYNDMTLSEIIPLIKSPMKKNTLYWAFINNPLLASSSIWERHKPETMGDGCTDLRKLGVAIRRPAPLGE